MKIFKKFLKLFFGLLGFISFMALLAVAGESDINGIEVNQLVFRGGVALIFLITCFIGQALLREDSDD